MNDLCMSLMTKTLVGNGRLSSSSLWSFLPSSSSSSAGSFDHSVLVHLADAIDESSALPMPLEIDYPWEEDGSRKSLPCFAIDIRALCLAVL